MLGLAAMGRKAMLAATAAASALRDPTRADAVAQLGEATGERALRMMLHQMMADPNGSRLLREKPRINTHSLPPGFETRHVPWLLWLATHISPYLYTLLQDPAPSPYGQPRKVVLGLL